MKKSFKNLERQNLQQAFDAAKLIPHPKRGWLHKMRTVLGLERSDVAKKAGVSPFTLDAAEDSERRGAISLNTLRKMANAMDCDVVYAIVPRAVSIEYMMVHRANEKATQIVRAAENTMALENQSVPGDTKEAIQETAKRILDRS